MRQFKVASVQTYSELAAPERNIKTVTDAINEAASNGAKLIVFPECMYSGYVWNDRDHALKCADPIPGKLTDAIAELTKKYDVTVAIGTSEKHNGNVYNSVALVGPKGVIGKYQKNFLFDFDADFFAWGEVGYPVYDTDVGRVGMFVCGDARIPEGSRALALNGAEIILHITNSTTVEQHEMHEPTRANENEAWFISADKLGTEKGLTYPGHSLVIAPDGTEIAHGSGDKLEIIYADIDLDAVKKTRAKPDSILRGRRPDTYGLLTKAYEQLPFAKLAETPVVPSSIAVLASALQVTNTDGDAKGTLDLAVEHGWEAARENARLIVFPELFLCPLNPTSEQARQSSRLTEQALTRFGEIAKQWKATYVLNLVEEADGKLYSTAYVVGPKGTIEAKYRKVHLSPHDAQWATAGNEYCVVQSSFGNVGILLGHEVRFLEAARVLTCMGADVIAMPSSWEQPREPKYFLRARALENKVFVVAANRLDAPVPGTSKVVLPNGATPKQAHQGQGDFIFHYLDLSQARDKQIRPGTDLIKNRRPALYASFVKPVNV
ncbi:Formamidase [Castellaniella defragrans]